MRNFILTVLISSCQPFLFTHHVNRRLLAQFSSIDKQLPVFQWDHYLNERFRNPSFLQEEINLSQILETMNQNRAHPSQMIRWWKLLTREGIRIDNKAVEILINGTWERARNDMVVLNKLFDVILNVDPTTIDLNSFRILLKMCISANNLTFARQLVRVRIENLPADYESCNKFLTVAMHCLGQLGDIVTVRKLFQVRRIDVTENQVIWNTLLNTLVKNESYEEVWELFILMQNKNLVNDSYTTAIIMEQCAKIGDLDRACLIFNNAAKNNCINSQSVALMVRCFIQANRRIDAITLAAKYREDFVVRGALLYYSARTGASPRECVAILREGAQTVTVIGKLLTSLLAGYNEAGYPHYTLLAYWTAYGPPNSFDIYLRRELSVRPIDIRGDLFSWNLLLAAVSTMFNKKHYSNANVFAYPLPPTMTRGSLWGFVKEATLQRVMTGSLGRGSKYNRESDPAVPGEGPLYDTSTIITALDACRASGDFSFAHDLWSKYCNVTKKVSLRVFSCYLKNFKTPDQVYKLDQLLSETSSGTMLSMSQIDLRTRDEMLNACLRTGGLPMGLKLVTLLKDELSGVSQVAVSANFVSHLLLYFDRYWRDKSVVVEAPKIPQGMIMSSASQAGLKADSIDKDYEQNYDEGDDEAEEAVNEDLNELFRDEPSAVQDIEKDAYFSIGNTPQRSISEEVSRMTDLLSQVAVSGARPCPSCWAALCSVLLARGRAQDAVSLLQTMQRLPRAKYGAADVSLVVTAAIAAAIDPTVPLLASNAIGMMRLLHECMCDGLSVRAALNRVPQGTRLRVYEHRPSCSLQDIVVFLELCVSSPMADTGMKIDERIPLGVSLVQALFLDVTATRGSGLEMSGASEKDVEKCGSRLVRLLERSRLLLDVKHSVYTTMDGVDALSEETLQTGTSLVDAVRRVLARRWVALLLKRSLSRISSDVTGSLRMLKTKKFLEELQ